MRIVTIQIQIQTHTYIYIRENISSQSNILLTIFYRQHEIYINAIMKLRKKNAK